MAETPSHLLPENCFVCGYPKADHEPGSVWHTITGHEFWSNADALAEATERDRRSTFRYSSGATTPEANYVATVRPG